MLCMGNLNEASGAILNVYSLLSQLDDALQTQALNLAQYQAELKAANAELIEDRIKLLSLRAMLLKPGVPNDPKPDWRRH
jgi:hypothetical protein